MTFKSIASITTDSFKSVLKIKYMQFILQFVNCVFILQIPFVVRLFLKQMVGL